MKRLARGTPNTTAVYREVHRETLRQARIAAYIGNHKEAARLYATIGIAYVHEVNETVRERDGLDASASDEAVR